MPKICVKCKKGEESGTKIQKYDYVRTNVRGAFSNRTTTTTVGISFPVCERCGSQFRKYQKFETFYDATKRYLILGSIILWIITIIEIIYVLRTPYINHQIDILVILLIVFDILLPVLYVALYYIVNKHPNKISQYIELTQDGRITIKDDKIKDEIIKKVAKDKYEYEQGINVIFCPKCGKKYPKGTDYCLSCGKDLRLL